MAEADFKLSYPILDSIVYDAIYVSYFGTPVLINTTLLQETRHQGTPVLINTTFLLQPQIQGTPVEISASGLVASAQQANRIINYWGYRGSQNIIGGFGRAQGRLKS